jgi:hypothetical protein
VPRLERPEHGHDDHQGDDVGDYDGRDADNQTH